ncbi:MAG: CCA tRNA nucleotidyltransferase [Candidatus Hydrogenedentales bacterium]
MDDRERRARRICDTLRAAGHRALFAGGCVRDMLLNTPPQDYDIATSARPEDVARLFPKTVDVGAAFGVQKVLFPEGTFEVATFRHDGPYEDGRHPSFVEFSSEQEDARRRDFTVNALFYDPEKEEVVDYVGGQKDLHRRIIRTVGDPHQRFREDYLRLLRAVRFAARLKYAIEPETLASIEELAPFVQRTSAERIRDELTKMLLEGGARRAFELLDQTRLLEQVLPEVARMKGVEQPPEYHPEGDVWTHTLLLLEELDRLTQKTPTLAYGALLHDVGKPLTQTFEDRIRFNLHDKVGARETEKICRRLRFSNAEAERVTWLVEQHMRLAAAPDMRASKLKRFVREPGFDELLEVHRLDCLSSHRNLDIYDWLRDYIANLTPEQTRPKPLITGNDLIAMGYEPGPKFKEILGAIEDAQLEGALTSPDSARAYVRENWPK